MPIPQLSRKTKSPKRWRSKKKKYYISHKDYNYRKGKTRKRKRKPGYFFGLTTKKIVVGVLILFLFGSLCLFAYAAWLSRVLPPPGVLLEREIAQTTKIFDRTGETTLYEIHGSEQRTLVSLDQIPDYLRDATVAIEDKDFYKHKGFSLWAMFRTAVTNVLHGRKAGGSTLTQQLIKNAILTPEKTYTRKIKELLLAYRVENKYSKDEILQMYLNEIPYGSTSYGVEAASQRYFGKSVGEISLAEATVLAALPQAPTRYSPYGSNKDLLMARQQYILDVMVEQDYISQEEADLAKDVEIEFREQTDNIIAPHFVMYIKEILAEKYGEKMIEQGGLKIYTTLDLYKQEIAEEVIAEIAPKNEENYNATNASLVSLDPKTGQILAMVGSRDYFDEEIDGQVNVALRPRQPGSSFKPIVYTAAFVKGYTPDTILYDVVTDFSNNPAEPYEPHNYDNKEHGPITIRRALGGSLNIPAVKTIYLAGIENVLDLADDLGYSTLKDRSRFGLSLVLGGGEVKLLEHVNAYGALAREGILHPSVAILKIEDNEGKIIEELDPEKLEGKKVVDAEIVRLINNILSDNAARAWAFGESNWLTLGARPVAAKTGTTNDYRDAWTIGYTPSIVTGVWVGNNDNSKMKRGAAGGTVAAPIWHAFMKRVLGDTPIEQFRQPKKIKTGKAVLDGEVSGSTVVKIDKSSGLLATEYTPEHLIEEKTFSEHHSILYYIDKNDPRGEALKNPAKDPQFELWESRILEWTKEQEEETTTEKPPTEYDNLHKPEYKPTFKINSPASNQTIMKDVLSVSISASAPRGINRAEYYINDNLLNSVSSYPFNLNQKINFLGNGFHKLKVRVCDDVDNCSEKTLDFNLIVDDPPAINDIGISWVEPSNGLAVTNIDFPLNLKVNVENPFQTAQIKFYTLVDDDAQLITTAQPVNSSPTLAKWAQVPASGTYKLYAESYGWNGQFSKTKEITITVTKIEEKEE